MARAAVVLAAVLACLGLGGVVAFGLWVMVAGVAHIVGML